MTVENEKSSTSFGRYLQAARIEKGVSLEAIAKETRIRLETLQQIEEENHENLPDEVFVRGFLRAYADAVGADGAEAVRKYNSRLAVIQKVAQSESDLKKSGSRSWLRLLLSLAALLSLIIVTIWLAQMRRSAIPEPIPEPTPEVKIERPQIESDPEVAEPASESESKPDSENVLTTVEKHLLRIETSEETWLKIIIDGQQPNEYNLFPGDRVELEALNNYNLLIGNSGGIELFLNNQPVEIAGKTGQVLNIQLP